MVIGLILIAIVIYWLFTMTQKKQSGVYSPNSNNTTLANAIIILNEQYARGEVGDDEYQHKKAELRNS